MIGTSAGPSVRDAMAHLLPSLANLSLRPTAPADGGDDPEDMPASAATGVAPPRITFHLEINATTASSTALSRLPPPASTPPGT